MNTAGAGNDLRVDDSNLLFKINSGFKTDLRRTEGRNLWLQRKWDEARTDEKQINDVTYRIRQDRKLKVVHWNKLAQWSQAIV